MGRLLPLRPEPSLFGRGCVKTIGAQFDLFILATYVRFRMTYSARVERYRTYGRARWSFYTASAACRRIGLLIADIQHENPRGVGKGRLLTLTGPRAFPEPVIAPR